MSGDKPEKITVLYHVVPYHIYDYYVVTKDKLKYTENMKHIMLCNSAFLCFSIFSHQAYSQLENEEQPAPEETSDPAPSVSPGHIQISDATDEVRLKNGSNFRGIISETVPNEYVIIVSISGQSHRFDMSEVEYAGPITTESPPQPAPQLAQDSVESTQQNQVAIRFESDQPELSLHRVVGTSYGFGFPGADSASFVSRSYEPVCTAPCQTTLPEGNNILALSLGLNRLPIETASPVTINGPSTLVGSYESKIKLRFIGLITLISGLVVGLPLMMTGALYYGENHLEDDVIWSLIGVGGAITLIAEVTGLILMFQRDRAYIEVTQ